MMINKSKVSKFEAGFTLIEMLVVITILGIIMGIAVLGFSGANRASIIKSCKVDYLSVQSALNSLKNDYPTFATVAVGGNPSLSPDSPVVDTSTLPTALYTQSSGTLASLNYMSQLNDNKKKYQIALYGTLDATGVVSLIHVTSIYDTSSTIATACTQ